MTRVMQLTPRRRNVLSLRAAGYSQDEIADMLGIAVGVVRKDVVAISRVLIPGTERSPRHAKGYTISYVLGLLDAGIQPEDVPAYVKSLTDRVKMRQSQAARIETERVAGATNDPA